MVYNKNNVNYAIEWLNEIDRLNGIIKNNSIHNHHSQEYINYLKKYIKKLKRGFEITFNGHNKNNFNYEILNDNTRHINESIESIDLLLLLLENHFVATTKKDYVWVVEEQTMELSKLLNDYLVENNAKPIYYICNGYHFKNSRLLSPIVKIIDGYLYNKNVYGIEKILIKFLMKWGDVNTFVSAEILSNYYKIDLNK